MGSSMKQAGTIFRLSAIYRTSDGLDMTYNILRNFYRVLGFAGLSLICVMPQDSKIGPNSR